MKNETKQSDQFQPQVGEIYQWDDWGQTITGKYLLKVGNYYVMGVDKDGEPFPATVGDNQNLRPINSMESELETILVGVTFQSSRKETMKMILDWHNKHCVIEVPSDEESRAEFSTRKYNQNFNAQENFRHGWNQCWEWLLSQTNPKN